MIRYRHGTTICNLHSLQVSPERPLWGDHFHNEVELIFVDSGVTRCAVSGEIVSLTQGNLIVIGSRVVHRLMDDGTLARATYLHMNLGEDCLEFDFGGARKQWAVYPRESFVERLFQYARKELEEKLPHYEEAVRGCAYQLAAFLFREGFLGQEQQTVSDAAYKKILPALEYAHRNFGEKVTLDGLSRCLHVDKYHFCKQFKKVTGTTFFDYLLFVRMKHAEKLLCTTDQSVSEVALACGFSTIQYFHRVFHYRYGCTPTAYRRMFLEGQK